MPFPFHHVGPRDRTQVVRLGSKHLSLPSYLACLAALLFHQYLSLSPNCSQCVVWLLDQATSEGHDFKLLQLITGRRQNSELEGPPGDLRRNSPLPLSPLRTRMRKMFQQRKTLLLKPEDQVPHRMADAHPNRGKAQLTLEIS